MEKGIAIVERNDTETKAVFIDKETIEFAWLNALTKDRIAKAEANKRVEQRKAKAARKENNRRKAYKLNTVKHILVHSGIIGGVVLAGTTGMIHPFICTPVALFSLCSICLRVGAWFGREGSK